MSLQLSRGVEIGGRNTGVPNRISELVNRVPVSYDDRQWRGVRECAPVGLRTEREVRQLVGEVAMFAKRIFEVDQIVNALGGGIATMAGGGMPLSIEIVHWDNKIKAYGECNQETKNIRLYVAVDGENPRATIGHEFWHLLEKTIGIVYYDCAPYAEGGAALFEAGALVESSNLNAFFDRAAFVLNKLGAYYKPYYSERLPSIILLFDDLRKTGQPKDIRKHLYAILHKEGKVHARGNRFVSLQFMAHGFDVESTLKDHVKQTPKESIEDLAEKLGEKKFAYDALLNELRRRVERSIGLRYDLWPLALRR